jgi:hypothetical protein
MNKKEERQAKAKERRAKLSEIWKQVGALSDEEKQAMIEACPIVHSCDGPTLSTGNTLLLAFQMQNVTVVGGYRQWQQYNRHVKKGEHGLGIWIPSKKKTEKASDEDEMRFFFGTVFDISQTAEMEQTE